MQINKVRLKNFRQFYGTQELEFPVKGKKTVTLIHAENGFGKTSILNAVLWTLFKQVTPKFERPDDIVNYEALDKGQNSALVEVEFSYENNAYLVQRTFYPERSGRDQTEMVASKIISGSLKPLNAAETFVSSVIPPEMAKYFFFDGEAAESFASARNYKEIANAIRNILGCSLAETAIADLKDLCKTVDKEIGDTSGDEVLQKLEERLSESNRQIELAVGLREKTIADIATFKDQYDDIVKRLREMQGAEVIQRERDEKVSSKKRVDDEILDCNQEIIKWIGQRSIQVLSKRLSKVALDFVDEASLRGRIPSPYNEDFVRGLLSAEKCVCHRDLLNGTKEWRAVAELLKSASNAEVLGRVVRARSRSQLLREEASGAPKVLAKLRVRLVGLLGQQRVLEQAIAELGAKIENLPIKEIADRERSRKSLESRLAKEQETLGGVKVHIVSLERERAAIEVELEEMGRKNKRTRRLFAKRQLLVKSSSLLRMLLERYEVEARKTIEDEVNAILEQVAHKDYRCRFNGNFGLELIMNDRATPKSGGENQLLSLAFIASLVKFASSRIDAEDMVLKPGTMAPFVLDAPLGQLDPAYQESVAEFLPKFAHQVILLVSGSQGGERVLKALEPFVGAEYLLVQENKGDRGKKELLRRVIRGKERDLILFSRPRTMTQIERLM